MHQRSPDPLAGFKGPTLFFFLFNLLVQFHRPTAFVSCRHIRSAILYVSFCLFVANKFDFI